MSFPDIVSDAARRGPWESSTSFIQEFEAIADSICGVQWAFIPGCHHPLLAVSRSPSFSSLRPFLHIACASQVLLAHERRFSAFESAFPMKLGANTRTESSDAFVDSRQIVFAGNHDDDQSPWQRSDLLKVFGVKNCVQAGHVSAVAGRSFVLSLVPITCVLRRACLVLIREMSYQGVWY